MDNLAILDPLWYPLHRIAAVGLLSIMLKHVFFRSLVILKVILHGINSLPMSKVYLPSALPLFVQLVLLYQSHNTAVGQLKESAATETIYKED